MNTVKATLILFVQWYKYVLLFIDNITLVNKYVPFPELCINPTTSGLQ